MPQPWTYRHASREYRSFLDDFKSRTDLISDNMAYTAIEAVLLTFRKRLSPTQIMAFADILPCVLRAIFVFKWDPHAAPLPFGAREDLTKEVQSHRVNHNLTPENAIEATAWTLWRHVNHRDFERVLGALPNEARDYWRSQAPESELQQKMV